MKLKTLRPLLPWEARNLGISWPYSVGFRANPNAGREVMWTNRLGAFSSIDRIDIARKFNLGNHVRQVSNAIRFAELRGIPRVRLPHGSVFSQGHVRGVELVTRDFIDSPKSRFLAGDFFYFEELGISLDALERGQVVEGLRPLVPLLEDKEMKPGLGIHLRSGDTFSSAPHPLYMPPPLSFFRDAIDRSLGAASNGVHVICQDLDHPYITAIRQFCDVKGIECEVSSSSLNEDFKSMASFEELCVSQGTLALAAAWLSGSCQRIFAFQRDPSEMLTTAEMGIRVESATSVSSLGPWTGAERQMALLSDVTATTVRWESVGGHD